MDVCKGFVFGRARRVPVVLQMSTTECGAACLAMVLSYFGRKTRVSECREHLGAGRDGLTAHTIVRGARHFGLRVKAFSLEPSAFSELRLPAIVHWNFNHFVVVERWSAHQVEIVDPASGRRRLSAEEFDQGFTGVALTFEAGDCLDLKQKPDQVSWAGYFKKMLHIPGASALMLQILGASLLLQGLGLTGPWLTKVLVDQVLPLRMNQLLPLIGCGIACMVLAQTLATHLRSTLLLYLEVRLDSKIMLGFFQHVLSLPFSFFQQRTSGDLLMRLGSNTFIREILSNQTLAAILDAGLVLGYLMILFLLAPAYGVLVLVLGAGHLLVMFCSRARLQELVARDVVATSEAQSYSMETLSGIAMLKASGAEERALQQWTNLFYKSLNISQERKQLSAMMESALMLLRTLSPLVLLWWGATRVLHGSLTLGSMFAFSTLALSALAPLASLAATGQQLQLLGAHLERLEDVLEAEPEQARTPTQPAPALSGRIEVQNLSFRYNRNSDWLLRDISFAIEPGQKIALVGRTGCGKSTLAKLLLGLYTPEKGQILYDNIPLEKMNHRTVRHQIGVVLQESFLFSGSIRENIALNHPELSLPQIRKAAALALIDEEIIQMPMNYETNLDESGRSVSGGQRQRLSLARALAQEPSMLILDEATSHLDLLTEAQVEENINQLSCTRVVIAHRLSTIQDADLILVLDKGTIVEQGNHSELMEKEGVYASLVHSSSADLNPSFDAAMSPSYR